MPDYRHRVCAVGTAQQMKAMLTAMLRNAAMHDDDEDTAIQPSMQEELDALHQLAVEEGGPVNGFLYGVLCRTPFGWADTATATMDVREYIPGLWTATFDYRSAEAFQPEDWLSLQKQSDGILICAQYACTDIAREKGRLLLAGGKAMDNWDSVDACWFYLTRNYLCGESPADMAAELEKLQPVLEQQDEELTPDVLLSECEENLRLVAESVFDKDALLQDMKAALESRDYPTVTGIMVTAAQAELWDADRTPRYLSCLNEARNAWEGRA